MKLARQRIDVAPSAIRQVHPRKRRAEIERISLHWLAAALLLGDIVTLFAAGVTPALAYRKIAADALGQYLSIVGVGIVLFLLISQTLGVYRVEQILKCSSTIPRTAASLLLMFFALSVAGIATKTTGDYSRVWLFSWVTLSLVLAVSLRGVISVMIVAKLSRGACLKRALIVNVDTAELNGDQLALETGNRVRAIGTVAMRDPGRLSKVRSSVQKLKPDIVVLVVPWSGIETAIEKLGALSQHPVEVLVLPESSLCLQKALRVQRFGNRALLQIMEPPLADYDKVVKRIEDLIVAIVVLFISLPVLVLTAIAIKLESNGPVLFKQVRKGLNGDLIEVWKFRSMYVDATDPDASRQTSKDDPRVTRIGRLIRHTSIDELPQFWNVILGTMSVVGPRPHAPGTFAEGKALDVIVEEYGARYRVKPGITGWAQVNGARGELRSREQVRKRVDYDLYYIENWSPYFDLMIILMTVTRMLYDPYAY